MHVRKPLKAHAVIFKFYGMILDHQNHFTTFKLGMNY